MRISDWSSDVCSSDLHVALLKVIALIDLFKDRSGLQATRDLLEAIAMPLRRSRTSSLLNDLIDWSVIFFRKHVGSFAIYAGSDFDIEAAVDKARQLGVGVDYRLLARFVIGRASCRDRVAHAEWIS